MVSVTITSTGQSGGHKLQLQVVRQLIGVLYGGTVSLKDAAEKSVSDEAFAKRSERWADDAGCSTKEAYFYRDIFECEFGCRGNI